MGESVGPVELVAQTAEPDNFAFVMNVGRLIDAASYTLAPGHELRRARANEVAFIKETIKSLGPGPSFRYESLWEQPWPHASGPLQLLNEQEWRYFVIAFKGPNRTVSELGGAFDLAPLELEVGFTAVSIGTSFGTIWLPGRLFHVLEDASNNDSFFVDASASEIDEVRIIHSQLQEHDPRSVDVQGLVVQLGDLKGLPHKSVLRFLGYFAILESLLTHAPKPSDPYDSITRQVKKKLALLDHRFPRAINYALFGGAAAETIWVKMYAYRSLVAHGGHPEFTGELTVLGNHQAALKLIKETVKAIIRQALSEPQLLVDLRDC